MPLTSTSPLLVFNDNGQIPHCRDLQLTDLLDSVRFIEADEA